MNGRLFEVADNVLQIAEGGALNHQTLIKIQNLITWKMLI